MECKRSAEARRTKSDAEFCSGVIYIYHLNLKILYENYRFQLLVEKEEKRPDISDYMIEYCIQNSNKLNDRTWPELFNAITRIPPSGRLLKVVYREKEKDIKIIITAYWLD